MKAAVVLALLVGLPNVESSAQMQRPRVDLTPLVTSTTTPAGARSRVSLKVSLPRDVHVQSDKPDDPSLIPTVLTVSPIPGVTVDRITYPAAAPFRQAGREKPLAVFGPDFAIDVQLSIAPTVPAGEIRLPAQLRYQACNERVCFAPARASAEWVITVETP